MTPHSFWYQEGSAASLRLHSKADVAMSTSCIIREAQLYRPQAACPFFYSRCEFPLLPLVFLLLGFKFWLSQLSVLPNTNSQGTCLAFITSRCHIEGCEVPFLPSSGFSPCSRVCRGKPRSPFPLLGHKSAPAPWATPCLRSSTCTISLHNQEMKSFPWQLPTAPGYQAAGLTLY